MTTNLSIVSELLTEKTLLDLLLSFGNSNDKESNLQCFINSLFDKLELSNALYLPVNDSQAFYLKSNLKNTKPKFTYNDLDSVLAKKKSLFISAQENKKQKFAKNVDYFLIRVSKYGILALSKKNHNKLFTNKKLLLVLKKFITTMQLCYENETKSFTEYKYKVLIHENNLGIGFIKDGEFREVNKSLIKLTGYSNKEILEINVNNLYDADTVKKIKKLESNFKLGIKKNHSFEGILFQKSGVQKNFKCSSQALYNVHTEYIGSINTFVDTTPEIKATKNVQQAQKKLSEKEAMLDKIIENSSQNILVIDKNKTLIHFNSGSKSSFKTNYGIDLKIGDSIFTKHKAFFDGYKKQLNRALKGEEISFEYTSKKDKSGKQSHLIVTFKPLRDESGDILGVISMTKDVTELINKNRVIEKRESSLRAIIESSADGMYAVDRQMNIIFINQQARKDFKNYLGVDLNTGDNFYDIIDHDLVKQWREVYYNKVFKGKRFVVNATMLNKVENNEYFVENRYSPVKDNEGNIFASLEISRNMTDLKIKEQDLQSKEAELRTVLEKTPAGIAKVDLGGKINFTTNKTAKLLGYKQNEIIGREFFSFIHPSDKDRMAKSLSKLIQDGVEVTKTTRILHGSKDECYIHGVASVIRDQNKKPIEFLIAFYDITEQVIAKSSLIKSEKRYKSLLEGSPAGLAQVNDQGKFVFVSKKGAEILGDDINNINNKNFVDYIEPKYIESVTKTLKTLKKANELMDFRVKGKSGKGDIFYLDGTATLLQDEFEGKFSTLFIFNDVTSRVLAEKELQIFNSKVQEKNAIYQALIDNSFDGIDIIELKESGKKNKGEKYTGNILIRNEKMNEYLGHSQKAFLSVKEILELSPPKQADGQETKEKFKYSIQKVLNEKYFVCDWRINATGSNEDFRFGTHLIHLKDRNLLIRTLRRITDTRLQQDIIKNQLDTLSTKNDELEKYIQSNLQLENFAYIASHDLKAPLRTVSSFSFLLKQAAYEKLDDKSKNYLDIVLRSSTNMQFLIDDLLAFSRVGTQKVKKKEILLGPMIKRILLDVSTNIDESKAVVNVAKMPKTIFADESMMIQIFQNFINNGLKFRKKDISPIVKISSMETKTHWIFKIQDNGIGIKEENIQKIFGIFEKLHSNDVYEGTGLGLSICKKIAEMHEGTIEVDSELDRGSTFTFSIKKN